MGEQEPERAEEEIRPEIIWAEATDGFFPREPEK